MRRAAARAAELGLAVNFICCDVQEFECEGFRFDLVLSSMALNNLIEEGPLRPP